MSRTVQPAARVPGPRWLPVRAQTPIGDPDDDEGYDGEDEDDEDDEEPLQVAPPPRAGDRIRRDSGFLL